MNAATTSNVLNPVCEVSHLKSEPVCEDIAGHIGMDQNDPGFAADPEARSQRLAAEMGSPGDLSRALRNVYRPSRWLDFLLVVFPTIFFLSGALQNFLFEYIEPWVSRNAPTYLRLFTCRCTLHHWSS